MLMQGTFSGTITLSQVFNDVVNVLSGSTTSFAGLSASFSAATFTNTTAPGWSSYDAAAGNAANGVTPCVVRAAYTDDGTKFKNVYINAANATQLAFNGYETWNSGTHTGTFPMTTPPVSTSTWQTLNLTSATYSGGTMIISATAAHFLIQVYTSGGTLGDLVCVSEYSRDDPWNTVANGYPSWLQTGKAGAGNNSTLCQGSIPRAYNPGASADTGSATILFTGGTAGLNLVPDGLTQTGVPGLTGLGSLCPTGLTFNTLTSTTGADSSKVGASYVYPISLRQIALTATEPYANPYIGGNLSTINGTLYYGSDSVGNALTTLSVSGVTYLVLTPANSNNHRLLVKVA